MKIAPLDKDNACVECMRLFMAQAQFAAQVKLLSQQAESRLLRLNRALRRARKAESALKKSEALRYTMMHNVHDYLANQPTSKNP